MAQSTTLSELAQAIRRHLYFSQAGLVTSQAV